MAINVATFTRSAIFVLPQTQKIAGGKISGFEKKDKTLRIQTYFHLELIASVTFLACDQKAH